MYAFRQEPRFIPLAIAPPKKKKNVRRTSPCTRPSESPSTLLPTKTPRKNRTIVAKEPRVLALDMGSTVPRKLEDLMRAFGEHASYADTTTAASAAPEGEDDDRRNEPGTGRGETSGGEATAAALTTAPIADGVMAEVLRYFPNALRFEPATLARKLEALQRAGLPPGVALEVVRGAPRCLSVAEGTLERRVSALREAFPSIPLSRLLGEAPCLLQNKIEPAAKVRKERGGSRSRGQKELRVYPLFRSSLRAGHSAVLNDPTPSRSPRSPRSLFHARYVPRRRWRSCKTCFRRWTR